MSALMEAIELASDVGTYYYDFEKQENVYLSEDSWNWDDEDKEIAELIDMEWDRFVRLPGKYDFPNKAYREFALRWCEENNIRCEMDE